MSDESLRTPTHALLDTINKWRKDMPAWVQIPAFVLLVLTWVFMLVSPSFIDGTFWYMHEGEKFLHKQQTLEVDLAVRSITIKTDSKGRFAIPKPGVTSSITFRYELPPTNGERSAVRSVELPRLHQVLGETHLVLDENQDLQFGVDERSFAFAFPSLTATAFAEEFVEADTSARDGDLEQTVLDAFVRESKVPSLSLSTELASIMSPWEESRVLATIERDYKIVLNNDRRTFNSIGDVVDTVEEQSVPESWESVMDSQWVKAPSLFGTYTLPITGTQLYLKPLRVFDDSVRVEIYSSSDSSEPLFAERIYEGERFSLDVGNEKYSVKLDGLRNAGWDRFFNPRAAFFSVSRPTEGQVTTAPESTTVRD